MNRLFYCPRCGDVKQENHLKEYKTKYCEECKGTLLVPKYIPSDKDYDDFKTENVPKSFYDEITKEMYEYIWNKYVDIPSNTKLNREQFENDKDAVLRNIHRNYIESILPPEPPSTPQVRCPRCGSTSISTQKKGFGVGKAAAGVVVAGPVGAVAGAAGANKVYNICQNCGHKWEPGK